MNRLRSANDELSGKRHLTAQEIDRICKAVRKGSRYPDRDELLIIMTCHHGFRVGEIANIKWQHIDLNACQITVKRLKNGIETLTSNCA